MFFDRFQSKILKVLKEIRIDKARGIVVDPYGQLNLGALYSENVGIRPNCVPTQY